MAQEFGGVLKDLQREERLRDAALDLFETHMETLLSEAKRLAVYLAKENGVVTSPDVVEKLEEMFPETMAKVDRRFMGAVFRPDGTWERVGFSNKGSHKQPISVWKLRSA